MRNFLLFTFFVILMACRKHEACDLPDLHEPFSESDTACIPYTGIDTLAFEVSDSMGTIADTIYFVGGGKRYLPGSCGENRAAGRCDQYVYGDAYDIQYFSDNSTDRFSIRLQSIHSEHSSGISIAFNKKYYFYSGQPALLKTTGFYEDTAMYNGRIFYRVAYAKHYDGFSFSDKVFTLLNVDYGIVRFVLPDGRTLTRLPL